MVAPRKAISTVSVLGCVRGEFSVEKYATLRPELLQTHMYDPDALWHVPDESKDIPHQPRCQQRGVDVIPETTDGGVHRDSLSRENAEKYGADLMPL
ncbi:hypothetical protein ACIP98_36225 [Streptomyces sp. NPDC088354]|uniref:hypothetical protein n=1 Tax=Streptomyces sp. NPDC088354 TaxID=3365856 RepID=UPI0038059BB4